MIEEGKEKSKGRKRKKNERQEGRKIRKQSVLKGRERTGKRNIIR
jgi:hypothetical protein